MLKVFLGDLPQPTHGMSKVNQGVLKLLKEGFDVVINTVPYRFSKFLDRRGGF